MTDRPDLQRLLEDIRARKIDVIVVYKADRVTRSLADFARLVELFATRSQHRSGKGSRIPIAQESELRAGLKREVRPRLDSDRLTPRRVNGVDIDAEEVDLDVAGC